MPSNQQDELHAYTNGNNQMFGYYANAKYQWKTGVFAVILHMILKYARVLFS